MKIENLIIYLFLGAVTFLMGSAVTAYLMPDTPWVWITCLALAVALFSSYIFMDRANLVRLIGKKTTLYGLNSVFMAVVGLAIVVVINMIASKYDVKGDFTKHKLHSLSDQSVKIIKNLRFDVKMRAFIDPSQRQEFEDIIDKYAYHSGRIKKEIVDVHQNPLETQKLEIKRAGTIVMESEARTVKVENLQDSNDPKLELKITNALIQVAKGEKRKIYFVSGHGELSTSDNEGRGYSKAKEILTEGRYEVQDLTLVDKEKISEDAEILVIAGAKSDFMEHELKMLEEYLKKGGRLLAMLEPDSTLTLKGLLSKYGVDWRYKKTVAELNVLQRFSGKGPLAPIVMNYDSSHDITQDLRAGQKVDPTVFEMATPVEKAKDIPKDLKVTSLFSTSEGGFEVVLAKEIRIDNTSRRGPISLALAVSGNVENSQPEPKKDVKEEKKEGEEKPPEKEFRLVVVGDADFAANHLLGGMRNEDLFQNMLSWLVQEEDLIAIRPKPTNMSKFEITPGRFKTINLASVVFAPLLMLFSAFAVWFSRRKK